MSHNKNKSQIDPSHPYTYDSNAINHPSTMLRTDKPTHIGFILQDNFSMAAFTAALDTLVTANLISHSALFSHRTFGVTSTMVKSDLGINVSADSTIESLQTSQREKLDILIVCGGLRSPLEANTQLSLCLRAADRDNLILGGLWNGAIALAHAGVLQGQECAAHPDNHAYLRERFNDDLQVSTNTLAISAKRATSAGPASALEMMLSLISTLKSPELVREVRSIIGCDQVAPRQGSAPLQLSDDPTLPEPIREAIQLMKHNIEEPLALEELSSCINISRRHLERLFQNHLETSPSRYYLDLRMSYAKQLLLQTNDSITNISLASGFVNTSHFSKCYKEFFGISPSAARVQH